MLLNSNIKVGPWGEARMLWAIRDFKSKVWNGFSLKLVKCCWSHTIKWTSWGKEKLIEIWDLRDNFGTDLYTIRVICC